MLFWSCEELWVGGPFRRWFLFRVQLMVVLKTVLPKVYCEYFIYVR